MTGTRVAERSSASAAPTAAVVAVGDELLAGRVRDTNSGWLAAELTRRGFAVMATVTAPDRVKAIVDALGFASARADAVVVTGGLGPTVDDRTFEALGRFIRSPLRSRPEVVDAIAARLGVSAEQVDAANRRQARLPAAASVLSNRFGTAPGALVTHRRRSIFVLPGVPREMMGLFGEEVVPRLAGRFGGLPPRREVVLRTSGLPEAEVALRLAWLTHELPSEVAFLVGRFGVDVRFPAGLGGGRSAAARLRRARRSLAPCIYEEGERTLPEVVLERLRRVRASLAVAESCSGGLLGAALTAVPGSSDVFWGGWMTYANAAKQRELGVAARLIVRHGAVSTPVARAMASGARRNARTTWGVGITGVAGPGGGTAAKPVGQVVIAWAGPGGLTRVGSFRFPGDRDAIRATAVRTALDGLRRMLDGAEPPLGGSG